MRNNQPVSQREVPLPPHHTLMSTTDPQGTITYANDRFVDLSGFRRDEFGLLFRLRAFGRRFFFRGFRFRGALGFGLRRGQGRRVWNRRSIISMACRAWRWRIFPTRMSCVMRSSTSVRR